MQSQLIAFAPLIMYVPIAWPWGRRVSILQGIKLKAGKTDRQGGGWGEGKEECFPWGTWIDEGSKETEEALLWVG